MSRRRPHAALNVQYGSDDAELARAIKASLEESKNATKPSLSSGLSAGARSVGKAAPKLSVYGASSAGSKKGALRSVIS